MRLVAAWLVLGVLCSSCYDPDLSMVRYKCDGTSPTCPAGLRCIAGVCVDPAQGAGCLSQIGVRVGTDIYACAGSFARGKAAGLCAPNYDVCQGGDGVDTGRCGPQGFFATRAQAHRPRSGGAQDVQCGAPGPGEVLLLMGCGSPAAPLSGDVVSVAACGGLPSALDCGPSSAWTCNSGIDDAVNLDPASGVLCCHR